MARIEIIAQNFDIYEGDGLDQFARTGDISLNHIQQAGASRVILGHSEVGDAPEIVNKKLLCAINQKNRNNVVLIGESWKEFENNSPEKVAGLMKSKCETVFKNIPKEALPQVMLGYEPKWGSRGSGRDNMPPPGPEFISLCIAKMKEFIEKNYGDSTKVYYIYGGRSTPERTRKILSDKNMDGLILGSACNTIKKTLDIANAMKDICKDRIKILVCNFKAYDLSEPYEEYVSQLKQLPDDFIIYLAPPYTEISRLSALLTKRRLKLRYGTDL